LFDSRRKLKIIVESSGFWIANVAARP